MLGLLSPDYKIEKWTPINSLTWGKAMAWDLRGNMGEEIERAVLLKNLTPEQVAQLFPAYPEDHPVIVNKIGDGTSASVPAQAAAFDIPDGTLAALEHNASLLDLALARKAMELVPTPGRFRLAHNDRHAAAGERSASRNSNAIDLVSDRSALYAQNR